MKLKKKIISIIFRNKVKDLLVIFYEIFSKFRASPEIIGLKLKKQSMLGKKNEIIYLPFDKYITWWVIKEGEYKHFIINRIKKIKNRIVFIDIGANTGLVSKQIYNLKKDAVDIHCFEPDLNNFHCLKMNVGNFAKCYNYGLSNINTKKVMYKFNNNHGKSTLLKKNNYSKTENILVKNINDQLKKLLLKKRKNTRVFVKFDTEGYDLFLISLLEREILNKIDYICFEYQRLNVYPFNQKKLLKNFNFFSSTISEKNKLLDKNDLINLNIDGQLDIILEK